jgi:hypothetical protein
MTATGSKSPLLPNFSIPLNLETQSIHLACSDKSSLSDVCIHPISRPKNRLPLDLKLPVGLKSELAACVITTDIVLLSNIVNL